MVLVVIPDKRALKDENCDIYIFASLVTLRNTFHNNKATLLPL